MTRNQGQQYSYQTKQTLKRTKSIKKDKGHDILIKGSTQEDDITLNTYAPNIGAPKYIKQILTDINRETDGNTIIVGDFNTPLTSLDRFQKENQ